MGRFSAQSSSSRGAGWWRVARLRTDCVGRPRTQIGLRRSMRHWLVLGAVYAARRRTRAAGLAVRLRGRPPAACAGQAEEQPCRRRGASAGAGEPDAAARSAPQPDARGRPEPRRRARDRAGGARPTSRLPPPGGARTGEPRRPRPTRGRRRRRGSAKRRQEDRAPVAKAAATTNVDDQGLRVHAGHGHGDRRATRSPGPTTGPPPTPRPPTDGSFDTGIFPARARAARTPSTRPARSPTSARRTRT